MAFCLLPLVGAFVGEVDFGDLEAILFLQCAFFNWVDFADPKAPIFRFCPLLVKSILLTSRYQFYFCSALSSMGPILMTLRHQFDFCPHFGEADFVDLEVPVYFLQGAFFNGVDFADPEARF